MAWSYLNLTSQAGDEVVLVSQGLEHVMRPLAQHLGVKWMIANRLEFRDGIATGRLLEPVVRPRGLFAGINGSGPDGRRAEERLVRDLGLRERGSSAKPPWFRLRVKSRSRIGRLFISTAFVIPARFRFAGRLPGSTSC